ncbi:very long chain fatty acid elongase 7-like [Battus philenor]|uniref:very long chain fatty acid elongase 7-like n=1 Tax=Battus philenor TaxID=42288 RepID=UPI0035CE91E8
MALLLKKMWYGYDYIFDELADPRSKGWFLVSSPITLVAILISYNYFCLVLGPMLMKNRQAFELKNVIKIYNLFQIGLSVYIFYEATVQVLFLNEFSFLCQGVNASTDPVTLRLLSGVWMYYLAKISELFDTIFFVFKKSYRQISFLHLYHHSGMAVAGWLAIKYFPGGQCIYVGWINSFVHIIMYTYYLLSNFGPKYKKYLWWKRYLTVMQIIQFGLISIQNAVSLFFDCGFPVVLKLLLLCGCVNFTWMFSSFYYNTYIKDNKRKREKCQVELNGGEVFDKIS